jgi:hypothetical protein
VLTCKQVTKLTSSDQKLSFMKRLEIRFHWLMCKNCRNYRQHLHLIKIGISKLFRSRENQISKEHLEELEKKILQSMNDKK